MSKGKISIRVTVDENVKEYCEVHESLSISGTTNALWKAYMADPSIIEPKVKKTPDQQFEQWLEDDVKANGARKA